MLIKMGIEPPTIQGLQKTLSDSLSKVNQLYVNPQE